MAATSWRNDDPKDVPASPSLESSRRLLLDANQKYPKKCMKLKAVVLDDLISRFKKKNNKLDDECEGSIKDRFHFVKRPESKKHTLREKKLNVAVSMLKKENEKNISDLVTVIKSTKFKIAADPIVDFSISRGVSTLSCYENIPREQTLDVADSNSCDSRPDVTEKLGNVNIDCDLYDVSRSNHAPPCMDLIKQTVSLDICANVQNNQTGSPIPIVESSLINFSSRFREYCTNMISSQLNEKLEDFFTELHRLQKNFYNRNNARCRYKPRYYRGFKEIERRLKLKKIKFVIIAPDLDRKGEVDNKVHEFIESCKRHEVAVLFGLSRRKLGYLTHGKGSASSIGVANYESLEEKLESALIEVFEAKNKYKELKEGGALEKVTDLKTVLTDDLFLVSERVKVLLKTLAS